MPPQPRHELIRASAGSGKTFELSNRYLTLLRLGHRPDRILASTFMRKAAGEIQDRVLLRLAQGTDNAEKLRELQTALDDDTLSHGDCLALLTDTVRQLHRLRIGTLDSFFAQLAGAYSLEIGLPPGWRIADEHEDKSLRMQAVDELLDSEDPSSLLTLVHALTAGEASHSLDREVRDKIDSLYSAYLETSHEAWCQVPRRRELSDVEVTSAIACLKSLPLPNDKRWEKARKSDVAAAETGDWSTLIQQGIAGKVAAGEQTYYGKPIDETLRSACLLLTEHARAVLLNQVANQTEATWRLLDKFHSRYQLLKNRACVFRFEDVTLQLARHIADLSLLEGSGANPDTLAFRLDGSLRHLLLDEFQDTSLAQWSILRPLARQITSASASAESPRISDEVADGGRGADQLDAGRTSFFCVGDPKQAIFGWRGGVAEIFDAVTNELQGVRQRPLDTNWRSAPPVIDAVNHIFQNLHLHNNLGEYDQCVRDWQREFPTHVASNPNQGLSGYVCLQSARVAVDGEDGDQSIVTLRFAAEKAAAWNHQAPGHSIGVLVRRNEAVRRVIFELRDMGIEASEEGGSSLDDSAAVNLILSLMHLADHPGDQAAWFHVRHSPLVQLSQSSDSVVPGEASVLASKVRRALLDDGVGRTIYRLAGHLASTCNGRELRRLEKLIGLAYQYDAVATSRPGDFVSYVQAARVRDPMAADVRVMTIHQAKGLEFDIVVLAELETDLVRQHLDDLVIGRPSPTAPINRICRRCKKSVQQLMPPPWQETFRRSDEQKVRESLCALYVATTRAIRVLHMVVAPSGQDERSLHKTPGGLLRAALTNGRPLDPEHIGFETGDRNCLIATDARQVESRDGIARRASDLAPMQVMLAPLKGRRWRGLKRASPSGLEGGTIVRLDNYGQLGTADRATARARGKLIHAWCEQIQWLDDGGPSDECLQDVAKKQSTLTLTPRQVSEFILAFRSMIRQSSIASWLSRAAYTEFPDASLQVETERPIAVRDGDRLLVGNMDRLVTISQRGRIIAADVCDFKTDAIAIGGALALSEKTEFYRPQLQAYMIAVSRLLNLPLESVTGRLLFLASGDVVPLT